MPIVRMHRITAGSSTTSIQTSTTTSTTPAATHTTAAPAAAPAPAAAIATPPSTAPLVASLATPLAIPRLAAPPLAAPPLHTSLTPLGVACKPLLDDLQQTLLVALVRVAVGLTVERDDHGRRIPLVVAVLVLEVELAVGAGRWEGRRVRTSGREVTWSLELELNS